MPVVQGSKLNESRNRRFSNANQEFAAHTAELFYTSLSHMVRPDGAIEDPADQFSMAKIVRPDGSTEAEEFLEERLDALNVLHLWHQTRNDFGMISADDETFTKDTAQRNCVFLTRVGLRKGIPHAVIEKILERGFDVARFDAVRTEDGYRKCVPADLIRRYAGEAEIVEQETLEACA